MAPSLCKNKLQSEARGLHHQDVGHRADWHSEYWGWLSYHDTVYYSAVHRATEEGRKFSKVLKFNF